MRQDQPNADPHPGSWAQSPGPESSGGPNAEARQRLQSAFGVPVLHESFPDDRAGGRKLAAALRPGRSRPWALTALLVAVLLAVGAVSALRSMPRPVDGAAQGSELALIESVGSSDAAASGQGGSTTGVVAGSGSEQPAATDSGGTVVVHVAGQVTTPGVVTLPLGARVAEAISAAGGALAGTSLDGLNLARRVNDGEQVYVGAPPAGAAPVVAPQGTSGDGSSISAAAPPDAPAPSSAGASSVSPIDLNTASSEELQQLPRVGPATAAKIIAHREENGKFTSVDQLLDVPGIGERTLEGLRGQVRV